MKLIDIIDKPFPDDGGYRLTSVQSVKKEGNLYNLNLIFHKIPKAREIYSNSHSKIRNTLRIFKSGPSIIRKSNVSYARLFVIGSIWWNEGEPMVVLPDYSFRYLFDSSVFDLTQPVLTDTSIFTDKHAMIGKYIDIKDGEEKSSIPRIILFDLKETVYHHQKENGMFPLKVNTPNWPDPAYTEFIAFHSYEVYRYFFTSYSITDLNERMMFPQFNSRTIGENKMYDPKRTIYTDQKYPVYLKEYYDLKDVVTIGNIAYYSDFRNPLRIMQNYLNKRNYYFFSAIERLPVSKFKSMTVSAIRVTRSSDGAEGLLVMQIHKCSEYLNHGYIPVVPQSNNNPLSSGQVGSRGSKASGTPHGSEPRVDNNNTSGMGAATIGLNLSGIEDLLKPSFDVNVENLIYEHHDSKGNSYFSEEPNDNNIVSPPGNYGNGGGSRPKEKIDVKQTSYFKLFSEIVEKTCKALQSKDLHAEAKYLDQEFNLVNSKFEIDCNTLKNYIKSEPNPNWSLFLAQIKIEHNNTQKYFYLFEKNSKKFSSGRTWLYSFPKFQVHNEENIPFKIKEFLNEKINSDNNRLEPDQKYNHSQSKKDDTGSRIYTEVDKKEAINSHVKKISNRILESCGLKPLQLSQIEEM